MMLLRTLSFTVEGAMGVVMVAVVVMTMAVVAGAREMVAAARVRSFFSRQFYKAG